MKQIHKMLVLFIYKNSIKHISMPALDSTNCKATVQSGGHVCFFIKPSLISTREMTLKTIQSEG